MVVGAVGRRECPFMLAPGAASPLALLIHADCLDRAASGLKNNRVAA